MLKIHHLRAYCLQQTGAVEEFPFGPQAAVYKVMGKMFALVPVDEPASISLKCDPEWAMLLRENYEAVQPGYHLNKKHWNTISSDGTVPDDEVLEMIRHSYALVVKSLKKADREALQKMADDA